MAISNNQFYTSIKVQSAVEIKAHLYAMLTTPEYVEASKKSSIKIVKSQFTNLINDLRGIFEREHYEWDGVMQNSNLN